MTERRRADEGDIIKAPGNWPIFVVGVTAFCGLAVVYWVLRPSVPGPEREERSAKVRASAGGNRTHDDGIDSPFRNTRGGVRYVGDAVCARCHSSIAESYRHHPMGRSIARVEDTVESVPDGVFTAQGFEYSVARRDGAMLHKETRYDDAGRTLVERAETMTYALGSGRGGKSYIFERDGYLFQSPISSFTVANRWDLAPGFRAQNFHFERAVAEECLYCHANQVNAIPGTINRFREPAFSGMAIGCERCHGPGELHAQRPEMTDGKDLSIVNPRHLDPVRRDSVCQQCHLEGDVRILRAGRAQNDFRPGLPFHRYWSVFLRPENLAGTVQIVGHVEQMEISRCYQASRGALACTSCHDPHRQPAETERVAFFRERCLECHADHGCSLAETTRRERDTEDSCIACHMPRTAPVDIPHAATTLHRIPRRPGDRPRLAEKFEGISPERDFFVHFHRDLATGEDRAGIARDLALATIRAAWERGESPSGKNLAERALPILERALEGRPGDLDVQEAKGLALLLLDRRKEALGTFRHVLECEPGRENATTAAASLSASLGHAEDAVELWRRALDLDPWPSRYWLRLAELRAGQDRWEDVVDACKRALRSDPADLGARKTFVEALLRLKETERAQREFQVLLDFNPSDGPGLRSWFQALEDSRSRSK